MDQQIYLKYLKEYTLEALSNTEDNVSLAAEYLEKFAKPSIFTKNRKEKIAALTRAKNVFAESRGRSVYLVLKSLGFDELAKDAL